MRLSPFLILIVFTSLIILFLLIQVKHRENREERYGGILSPNGDLDTSDLPPLNYFTLQEPAYFFYDPEVHGETRDAGTGKTREMNFQEGHTADPYQPSPVYPLMHSSDHPTTIGDIFGQDNYLRYYLSDSPRATGE